MIWVTPLDPQVTPGPSWRPVHWRSLLYRLILYGSEAGGRGGGPKKLYTPLRDIKNNLIIYIFYDSKRSI